MLSNEEAIATFDQLKEGWLVCLNDSWWAFYPNEKPLGPFETKADACRAGLEAWGVDAAASANSE
jgi:hypothetical protein